MGRCAALLYLPSLTLRCQLEVEHVVHEWRHENVDAMEPTGEGLKGVKATATVKWGHR
jgi:hypothetical protein